MKSQDQNNPKVEYAAAHLEKTLSRMMKVAFLGTALLSGTAYASEKFEREKEEPFLLSPHLSEDSDFLELRALQYEDTLPMRPFFHDYEPIQRVEQYSTVDGEGTVAHALVNVPILHQVDFFPFFSLTKRLEDVSNIKVLPDQILDLCAAQGITLRPEKIELFHVLQEHKPNLILYPHYWLFPGTPRSSTDPFHHETDILTLVVGRGINKGVTIGGGAALHQKAIIKNQTEDYGPTMIASLLEPSREITGLQAEPITEFWSVIYHKAEQRAAVTLHTIAETGHLLEHYNHMWHSLPYTPEVAEVFTSCTETNFLSLMHKQDYLKIQEDLKDGKIMHAMDLLPGLLGKKKAKPSGFIVDHDTAWTNPGIKDNTPTSGNGEVKYQLDLDIHSILKADPRHVQITFLGAKGRGKDYVTTVSVYGNSDNYRGYQDIPLGRLRVVNDGANARKEDVVEFTSLIVPQYAIEELSPYDKLAMTFTLDNCNDASSAFGFEAMKFSFLDELPQDYSPNSVLVAKRDYEVTKPGAGLAFCGEGWWHFPEDVKNWGTGKSARLHLNLSALNPHKELSLSFDTLAFVHNGHTQVLSFRINSEDPSYYRGLKIMSDGKLIKNNKISYNGSNNNKRVTLKFCPHILRIGNFNEGVLKLDFIYPESISPSLFDIPDTRHLGVALTNIRAD
ncbi:MAG: hypothetical protein ACK5O7_05030 [Holosporales bacterium]